MGRDRHPYLRGELVVVIDCSELDRSAEFWTSVLGYVRDGGATGRYQALLPADGKGAEILLQQVPEGKQAKNRVHLDEPATGGIWLIRLRSCALLAALALRGYREQRQRFAAAARTLARYPPGQETEKDPA